MREHCLERGSRVKDCLFEHFETSNCENAFMLRELSEHFSNKG
jgi:hypothetical protein